MKSCVNCLHRHGLNLSKCVPCWTHSDRPNWETDGQVDKERKSDGKQDFTLKGREWAGERGGEAEMSPGDQRESRPSVSEPEGSLDS